MKTSRQKQSYEVKRLNYLLENKLGEIKAYKEELEGLKQINSLCASFIHYFITKEGSKHKDLQMKIPKEDIGKSALKYCASCSSDDNFYIVTLSEKEANEEEKER